jgi:hypothetical protein
MLQKLISVPSSLGAAVLLAALVSCQTTPASPFAGTWRTVLDVPDGGLPFHIEIIEGKEGLHAAVRNGEEVLPFTTVEVMDDAIKLVFEHYDAWFEGRIDPAGATITGDYVRRRGKDVKPQLSFTAYAGAPDRFESIGEEPARASPIVDVTGKWDLTLGEGDDGWRALAILDQDGRRVTGTILTTVGDFRYLEGTFEKGTLRLSVFDGCHAFLVRAEARSEEELTGTFWFGSHGIPLESKAGGTPMPDPWSLTRCVSDAGTFSFSFPDADGNVVSSDDARFAGRPLVVCVIGTWCCNCYDAGRLLAELYEEYHPRGLEMVALACEATGDFEIDAGMMRAFSRCWDIDWPVLHVGRSNKQETLEALPDLDTFLSYPTTLFIDRLGKVRRIHTGFTGPGTGEYYERMCQKFRGVIEEMLDE